MQLRKFHVTDRLATKVKSWIEPSKDRSEGGVIHISYIDENGEPQAIRATIDRNIGFLRDREALGEATDIILASYGLTRAAEGYKIVSPELEPITIPRHSAWFFRYHLGSWTFPKIPNSGIFYIDSERIFDSELRAVQSSWSGKLYRCIGAWPERPKILLANTNAWPAMWNLTSPGPGVEPFIFEPGRWNLVAAAIKLLDEIDLGRE